MSIDESWVPVDGYVGIYDVSNMGRVKTIGRRDRYGRPVREKIRRPAADPKGYLRLFLCHDGKNRCFLLHRIVARAFLGPCPSGYTVNHINGVKTDNREENLEYATKGENSRHAYRMGLLKDAPVLRGESHHNSKLTDELVRDIRRTRGSKSCLAWAHELGLSKTVIRYARSGKTWSHVI